MKDNIQKYFKHPGPLKNGFPHVSLSWSRTNCTDTTGIKGMHRHAWLFLMIFDSWSLFALPLLPYPMHMNDNLLLGTKPSVSLTFLLVSISLGKETIPL